MAKPKTLAESALYVRISDDREGAGLGVARQEKDCRELAARLDWTVTDLYVDNDLSAYNGRPRPEYLRLLDTIRTGRTTRVLAWHTDRLHRNNRELEDYIDAAEMHGAMTHCYKAGPLDLSNASGRMTARIHCAVARHESEHKAERQRAKHQEIAEAGKPNGGIRPYGWQPDRTRLDPAEHAIITETAARLLAGESLNHVASDLNTRAVPTVTGRPWTSTVLRTMLTRPRIAGLREHNGKIIGKAVWQPALPETLWRDLRDMLTDPARRQGGNARRWLLTGIAHCPAGHPVTTHAGGTRRAATSRSSYHCPACGIYRACEPVDLYVSEAVLYRLRHLTPERQPDADPKAVTKLEDVRRQMQEVADSYADMQLTAEQVTRVNRRLRAREAELLKAATPPRRRRLVDGLTAVDNRAVWEALPLDRKRRIVVELVDVIIHPAGISRRVFHPETVELRWR